MRKDGGLPWNAATTRFSLVLELLEVQKLDRLFSAVDLLDREQEHHWAKERFSVF